MKRFLPLLLTAFLFTCCNNSQHRYDELNAKYSGKYIVKDMITDTEDIYDLFNTGNSSYDVYYQFAWKSTTTATDVKPGRVTVSLSSEERISATFLMELQAMYAGSVMPPYTAATEVTTATNLQTWRQSFDGVIQSDGTIKWADGVSEEDPYHIDRALFGSGEIVSFDGKTMDIHFEEFPIYDYTTKKIHIIHLTYHLERE